MCTAITYKTNDHYFGRNLDLEYSYNEEVTITPRNFPLQYRQKEPNSTHLSIIGMASVYDNYPLYYDATNEAGLSMAGLNFPGNAVYQPQKNTLDNITPFEFIPWILSQCTTVSEAEQLIKGMQLVDIPFNDDLPLTPLHWIIADENRSIIIEPMQDGLRIYESLVGVLTNNPPFDYHMHNLTNFLSLSREEPENRLAPQLPLHPHSRGMGAIGLPGDLSSVSRFVKAAFTKLNSVSDMSELPSVTQFFHILGAVEQQEGCVKVGDGFEKTVYTSCCNTSKGIYYYVTYENRQITAVHLHHEKLDSSSLCRYPIIRTQQIRNEN